MKNLFFLLLYALLVTGCASSETRSFIPASNSKIVYTGRFDFTDGAEPVFMYSGCSIRAVFSGSSIEVILKDDSLRNMFNVIIDDSLFVLTTNNQESRYLLASSLNDERHSIEIFRRTEWTGGNTVFGGFFIDRGKKLFSQPIRERRIEFIGDSYTCGYGNEGSSREDHFRFDTENNYLAFGAITSRALNADYLAVCRSGIGIWQGYGGDKEFTMPKLYDEVIINSKNIWNFEKYSPQLVVIDLAGNDLSVELDTAAFIDTYIEFLKRIRNNYSSAKIVCIAGPSPADDEWDLWKALIHSVVDQYGKTDPLVSYFEFTPFEPNGSDWHPNVLEHQRMAEELIPYLRKLQNW